MNFSRFDVGSLRISEIFNTEPNSGYFFLLTRMNSTTLIGCYEGNHRDLVDPTRDFLQTFKKRAVMSCAGPQSRAGGVS